MRRELLWKVGVVLGAALIWTALWSDLSIANAVWGLVVGWIALLVVPLPRDDDPLGFSPVGLVVYLLNAAWALVKSSAIVAWEVVTPGDQLNQAIVEVPLRTRSVGLTTLVANTVSLTPGTLTLEIRREPPALFVHVMHLRTIDEIRAEITHLEDLALKAFPPLGAPDADPGEAHR